MRFETCSNSSLAARSLFPAANTSAPCAKARFACSACCVAKPPCFSTSAAKRFAEDAASVCALLSCV